MKRSTATGVVRGPVPEQLKILTLIASGLMKLDGWQGPVDSRRPYPPALQDGLDRLTWLCWSLQVEPPTDIGDLVWGWCQRPLMSWGVGFGGDAVDASDVLLIDGRPSETCSDWAADGSDVLGDLQESQFMHEVMSTCRSMGPQGQRVYVTLRRMFIEEPVLSAMTLIGKRNAFPDLRVWGDWIDAAYPPVPATRHLQGDVAACGRCRQLMLVAGDLWRCGSWRCQQRSSAPKPEMQSAKETVALRTDLVTYVSLPGRPEVDLAKRLRAAGADVHWWPDVDRYDLLVVWPDGRRWALDVKDWRVSYRLAQNVKPIPVYPAGHQWAWDEAFVVIPDDRVKRRNYLRTLRQHSEAVRSGALRAVSVKDLLAAAAGQARHGA